MPELINMDHNTLDPSLIVAGKQPNWTIESAVKYLQNCGRMAQNDIVEVVRCKDCVYSRGFAALACPMVGRVNLKDDDFCSRGERKK